VSETTDGHITAPEPDLTPQELIARAAALRPMLVERQAEVEERTYYAEDVHRELQAAGIYRTFVPRRYGGYAFDVPTFARIGIELARGCPSTAWCAALASNHALHVGSFFPEQAQAEAFGDGEFRAPAVTAPIGVAQRTADGWELTGSVAYCSGAPYSTHYMGQAFMPDEHGGNSGRQLMFLAPRSEWEMVEGSWGDLLGLKGSGSHTLRFDHGHVPSHAVLEDTIMVDVEVEARANVPGVALHGDPMYGGRTMGLFTITLAAIMVGAVYNALDEYESQLHAKMTALPPFVPRREDPDYQRYFGAALAKIGMAEAALLQACEQHMEHCRRAVEESVPYTFGADMLIGCIAREVMVAAWETMQADLFRTSGSSAAKHGERMERIYRDLSMGNSHRNTLLRDFAYREVAKERLGIPRQRLGQQRALSGRAASQGITA
jgi:3-hydroxy-9,10-secoandrosta-1,3,5(10)-triene-9,17-dione monooxygenase